MNISEYDEPHALVVLVEEELIAIDLEDEKWPTFTLPYANSLHSSAITCSQHISNVPEQLWTKITDVGNAQLAGNSKRVGILLFVRVISCSLLGHPLPSGKVLDFEPLSPSPHGFESLSGQKLSCGEVFKLTCGECFYPDM